MGANQYLAEMEAFLKNFAAYEAHRVKTLNQQLITRKSILKELKKRRK